MSKKQKAFTLVELLVVIGIIAVLIGVLLPALARARDSANSAKCLSNMRQAGLTLQFYLNEYKGRWLVPYKVPEKTPNYTPTGSPSWNGVPLFYTWLSGHYMKENPAIWICPSDRYIENDMLGKTMRLYAPIKDTNCSYYMNRDMPTLTVNAQTGVSRYPAPFDHVYFLPRPLKGVKNPTKLIVFGESAQGAGLATFRSVTTVFRWDHRKQSSQSLCFADGHAEQLDRNEILLRSTETLTDPPVRVRELWYGHPSYTGPQITPW